MTTTEYERQAFALGVEHAKNAASWTVDGNTTQEHVRSVLAMLDDGDPVAYDYLPACPDLSGQRDDLSAIALYEDITGLDHADATEDAGLAYETLVGSVVDALAEAWEQGVFETFQPECERILREAIA